MTALSAAQATADALAVLKAAGFSEPGFATTSVVRVESASAAHPGGPGVVATTVRKAGPLTDMREAARVLHALPGVRQVSAGRDSVIVIREMEC